MSRFIVGSTFGDDLNLFAFWVQAEPDIVNNGLLVSGIAIPTSLLHEHGIRYILKEVPR